jgi:exodeoxyribonuclease VII small subunit
MKQPNSQKSYREIEADLQQILTRLEQGEYEELDELLADHATAEKLLATLQKKLDTAQLSIKKVTPKE